MSSTSPSAGSRILVDGFIIAVLLIGCTGQIIPINLEGMNVTESSASYYTNLTDLTAAEAVKMLCDREVSAEEYAFALLQKAQEWQCLNTWAGIDSQRVLREAAAIDRKYEDGQDITPLCGLTLAVKDLYDVAGYTTNAGNPVLGKGVIQTINADMVQKLLKANGVILGKTRMHELAYGVTSINPHFGPVLNPYNQTRIPGGSSGGTGTAIASRTVPAGLCTDTGGSCRIPAALNGVAGLRPTWGCYPTGDGVVPLSPSRDTPGVMARTVADISMFNAIFSECNTTMPPVSLAGMRLGYPTNFWADLGPETERAFKASLDALQSAGAVLAPFNASLMVDYNAKYITDGVGYTYEMGGAVERYAWRHGYNLSFLEVANNMASPATKATVQHDIIHGSADKFPATADYLKIMSTYRPQLQKIYNDFYDAYGFDVMVMPMVPSSAPPIHSVEPYMLFRGRYQLNRVVLRRTCIIEAIVGAPGLSVPIGLADDGLPVALQLQVRPGNDNLLLATGEAVEEVVAPTPPPPPPQCTGCTARALTQVATFNGTGQPEPGQTTSVYTLAMAGTCPLARSLRFPLRAQSNTASA